MEDAKTLDDYEIGSGATLKVRKKAFEIEIQLKEQVHKERNYLQTENGLTPITSTFTIRHFRKIKVFDWDTIGEVKECFVDLVSNIKSAKHIILLLDGEPMDDSKTIGDYEIKSDSEITYRRVSLLQACSPFAKK